MNRFSVGYKADRRQARSRFSLLPLGLSASSSAIGPLLRFLSRLAENEFEERDSPAWKFPCGFPWICLLEAEVRSVCF